MAGLAQPANTGIRRRTATQPAGRTGSRTSDPLLPSGSQCINRRTQSGRRNLMHERYAPNMSAMTDGAGQMDDSAIRSRGIPWSCRRSGSRDTPPPSRRSENREMGTAARQRSYRVIQGSRRIMQTEPMISSLFPCGRRHCGPLSGPPWRQTISNDVTRRARPKPIQPGHGGRRAGRAAAADDRRSAAPVCGLCDGASLVTGGRPRRHPGPAARGA